MEHKTPPHTRPDTAFDPSIAPVGPLIPIVSDDPDPGDTPIAPPESENYDPAEYRWVPVRRRPRYDGWTEEKQRRFIEALADTGLVSHAAKSVCMSRESANRLRRSPHGAAFARAWDSARLHAGAALEDIAFERAIAGVEHDVFNEYGDVVATKRVMNDRLLTFLLSHLMPERYGKEVRGTANQDPASAGSTPAPVALEASLRAMEPRLPAPPEELLGLDLLADELMIADIADGELPKFLSEQPVVKSAAQLAAEATAAQALRGKMALQKEGELDRQELIDMCHFLDPTYRREKGRKRYR